MAKIVWRYDGVHLTEDGELNEYEGKYHNDVYYNSLGNIFTDLEALQKFIALVEAAGASKLRHVLREALQIR